MVLFLPVIDAASQLERQIAANAILLKRHLSLAVGAAGPSIFMRAIRSKRGG